MVVKQKVGRPTKFKHGRPLTGAERVRALRAKRTLATANLTSPQYKRAKDQLEALFSKNPNKAKTELKDRFGRRVDIHGFGWKDTDEYRNELKMDRYWGVSAANRRRRKYKSDAERVRAWRIKKKIEKEAKEEMDWKKKNKIEQEEDEEEDD